MQETGDEIWDDPEVQKLVRLAGVREITTGMKISWMAQVLDWKDKGYDNVNLRKKFLAHCVGCKNGSGQDLGIVDETPGSNRVRDEYVLDKPLSMKDQMLAAGMGDLLP